MLKFKSKLRNLTLKRITASRKRVLNTQRAKTIPLSKRYILGASSRYQPPPPPPKHSNLLAAFTPPHLKQYVSGNFVTLNVIKNAERKYKLAKEKRNLARKKHMATVKSHMKARHRARKSKSSELNNQFERMEQMRTARIAQEALLKAETKAKEKKKALNTAIKKRIEETREIFNARTKLEADKNKANANLDVLFSKYERKNPNKSVYIPITNFINALKTNKNTAVQKALSKINYSKPLKTQIRIHFHPDKATENSKVKFGKISSKIGYIKNV